MPSVSVRVQGLNQLVRSLQKAGVEVDDLKGAFSKMSRLGADYAAGFAPKRTGKMAARIRGNKAKNKAVVMAGGATTPYAGVNNYGWPARGIEASGFMQKASDRLEGEAPALIDQELNDIVRRVGL